jgi:transcriptional regulator with XRE-family HTH domain
MTWHIRLTHAREAAGLTKSEMALRVGVSQAAVTGWESGAIGSLTAENLLALSDVLTMTPHWLMRGQGIGPGDMLIGHDMGERIRAARQKKAMSQEKLAEALGVSKGAVSQWETNATSPRKDLLASLADVLGVTVNWLVGHDVSDLDTVIRRQTHLSGLGLVSQLSSALDAQLLTADQIDLIGGLVTQFVRLPQPPGESAE